MFLSDRQVASRYNVSRGTPWRWVKTIASFPKPVELTPGCTRWSLVDLEAWEARGQGDPQDLPGQGRKRDQRELVSVEGRKGANK